VLGVAVATVALLSIVAASPAAAARRPPAGEATDNPELDEPQSTPSVAKPHVSNATRPDAAWCGRVRGGPGGSAAVPIDLSAAHALVREFSVDASFHTGDAALVSAMRSSNALNTTGVAAALATYADQLDGVCAVPARNDTLRPARVQLVHGVAVVNPGTGSVALPPGATAVVIDLRNLPAVPGLQDSLRAALAPALAHPVGTTARRLRKNFGSTDEYYVQPQYGVYSNSVAIVNDEPFPATGARDLPVVLLTETQMAPAAAAFAGTLRMANRAWIVGEDVVSDVAETTWRGVGGRGLATRTFRAQNVVNDVPEQVLTGQAAAQDDPNSPATATYRRDVVFDEAVPNSLDVTVDGLPTDDLDLFVLEDANHDGVFHYPDEVVGESAGATADEHVTLPGVDPTAAYQIWVHGYAVPESTTTFTLHTDVLGGGPWPDVIPADDQTDPSSPAQAADIARLLAPHTPSSVNGPSTRTAPEPVDPFRDFWPTSLGRPELRASLLIVHGLTRMFFEYFPIVGDNIDPRLLETLGSVETWDGVSRVGAINILRRFGETLHDGHQFTFNFGPRPFIGYLAVALDEIGGYPVVRTSRTPGVHSGDTILSINGRPTPDIYAEEATRTSAATPGYLFDVISRTVVKLTGPATLQLRAPSGSVRTVTVTPQPVDDYIAALKHVHDRRSGPLTDLGASDVYYLNMDRALSPTTDVITAAIADAEARGARSMVVDMRGYPDGDIYDTAARLIGQPFQSPVFQIPTFIGPDSRSVDTQQYTFLPRTNPSFNGPIVLVTGPHAVSAAENLMQLLVGAHRPVAVVGQPSAGTNGSLTTVLLPGALGFSFTGMGLLNPDGSTFHGVGIQPDVTVPMSATDFRDGVDRDLLTAIDVLEG
jgi:C-terminal processing protease CtpA/Prc